MVCTSLGSLLRSLFYFLCYIHFSHSVLYSNSKVMCKRCETEASQTNVFSEAARVKIPQGGARASLPPSLPRLYLTHLPLVRKRSAQ